MSRRTKQINELLREEIGKILVMELADPRLETTNITAVQTSPDLQNATVYYSSFSPVEEREAIGKVLHHAAGFVRKQLAGRLHLRKMPRLDFQFDESRDEGIRIDSILKEVDLGPDEE